MKEVLLSLKMPSEVEGIFFEKQKKINQEWVSLINSGNSLHVEFESHLMKAITYSDFIFEKICQDVTVFKQFLDTKILYQQRAENFYQQALIEIKQQCDNHNQWMSELRKFRNWEMLRFIWREVNGLCTLQESAAEISDFACAAVDVSLDFLYQQFCEQFGKPLSALDARPQKLSVLGMGKLGGRELNLSSDIDLIFFYGESGYCDGPRNLENQQFFTRLAQQLIRTLDERTVDGFVFRVDMRLRPYGEGGLLVINQDAMELYYETQGRTWERYALIKAACIAGDINQGEKFLEIIKPFVYRKYVDFTVLEALREMKLMINRQVVTKGLENDIKIGEGGIRETEFIVQALQLIQGGRKPQLQNSSYYQAMKVVLKLGLMSSDDVGRLVEHYSYFRRIEHLLQGQADQQTQMLPTQTIKQTCLAWVAGEESYQIFFEKLQKRRMFVREIFNELFANDEQEQSAGFDLKHYQALWLNCIEHQIHFSNIESNCSTEVANVFSGFAKEKILLALSESEKKRIDWCMAYLIYKICDFSEPVQLLEKAIKFLRVILKRSVYLVLLSENPKVFDYLLSLFQRSEWVLDNLLQHPFLLDELLQLQNRKKLSPPEQLFDELYQLSLRMDGHDLETILEELRIFKCTHEMQAAALYLDKDLNTSDLGDYLSALAEALTQEICRLAIKEVCKTDQSRVEFIEKHFAVLAYGKLGSRELGFGSDLDLVFVFDDEAEHEEDVGRFLTRYAQKIIHLLSVRTYSGILYEVDIRLRPSGNSGPMVSSLKGFQRYQNESAWTWEHQALVKARVVYGSNEIRTKFSDIRAKVLTQVRDESALLADMKDMRRRLHENSPAANQAQNFHIKSDEGGIVDIEFLAQFLVLSQSHQYPAILAAHATLEIFNFVENEASLKPDWLPELRNYYFEFRRQVNELTLAYRKVILDASSFSKERQVVQAVWENLYRQHQLD